MAKFSLLWKTSKLWPCRCHGLTCINSPSLTFSLICLEISGTGGYMRNVSIMHLSMYFICNVSWNVTGLSESPNIEYSSSTTFCWNENVQKSTWETSIWHRSNNYYWRAYLTCTSWWAPIRHKKKLLPAAVVSWP